MSILEDGTIVYEIPEDLMKLIDYKFCKQMLMELHLVMGVAAEDFDYDSVGYCEGTGGWYECLMNTCRKLNLNAVAEHYMKLPWYDSDIFDYLITEEIVKNKLLLPEYDFKEISRQTGISDDDIGACNECGKYYQKKDLVLVEEIDDCESEYICKHCQNKEDVTPLDFDRDVALKDLLGLSSEDYFKCESCNKIHFLFNKGEKHCKYCEDIAISENKNANHYYLQSIDLNEKYTRSLLPKILTYKDFESEVSYSKEDDLFYGTITKYKDEKFTDFVNFHSKNMQNINKQFKEAVEDYLELKKSI